jgi:hypothetical protein
MKGLLKPPKPKSDSFLLLGSHPLGQQIEELSLTASGDAKFSNQQNPWGWNFSHPGANGTILIASSSSPSSADQSQVSFFQRNQEFFALELCLGFSQGHQLHTY